MNPLPMGFLTLSIYLTFSFSLFHLTHPLCHNNERSALLQFKQTFLIINSTYCSSVHLKTASWNLEENSDCCSWEGVYCNEDTGFVIKLDLYRSCLQGSINSSSTLFNLVHLQWLSLANNDFSHSKIPSAVKNLSKLSYLDFSDSHFFGQIPSEMLELSRLESLDLSGNDFSHSKIPSAVKNLSKLSYLDLSDSNFSSQIPSEMLELSRLESLDLSRNDFNHSKIPSAIKNLSKLSYLDLSDSNFSGQIPSEMLELSRLESLDLSGNSLQLQQPGLRSLVEKLTNLKKLDLTWVNISSSIPNSLGNLSFLTELSLQYCQLQGIIPSSLGNLSELASLDISSNELSGPIPYWLMEWNKLSFIDFSSNQLSGRIPSQVSPIPYMVRNARFYGLRSLNLSNNLLTGFDQRHVFFPWIHLRTLDLRSNRLQGSLPRPISSINHYLVSNNNLTGEIPPWICTLNQLQALDLSHNNLSGVLPQCLGNFSDQLSVLGLQSNNFYGSIPQFFMIGSSLRMIDLSHNKLQGKIPRSLANCISLEFLNLGYNQINDLFPSWLGILPKLKVLILKFNRFHGVIKEPKTNFEFSKLHIIDLSHNMFMGELPSKYFQCWNAMKVVNESQLTYMQESLVPSYGSVDIAYRDGFSSYAYSLIMSNQGTERKYWKILTILTSIILSGNQFTGQIPTSISNLRGLIFLNLSHNHLLGHIPSSLGNLRLLESLDLSSNRLSGEIPSQLVDLTFLGFFNVSQNQLKGRIPQGKQFDTFESSSFEGNPGLCGKPLSKGCGGSNTSEKREDEGSESSTFPFDWKIVLTGFVSGLIVGVILGNEYFTKIVEWFDNLWWQLKTVIKRKTRGHIN